jgi:hypothetical protein
MPRTRENQARCFTIVVVKYMLENGRARGSIGSVVLRKMVSLNSLKRNGPAKEIGEVHSLRLRACK